MYAAKATKRTSCIFGLLRYSGFSQPEQARFERQVKSEMSKLPCWSGQSCSICALCQDGKELLMFWIVLPSAVMKILKYLNVSIAVGGGFIAGILYFHERLSQAMVGYDVPKNIYTSVLAG
jgi:hypothetical protein